MIGISQYPRKVLFLSLALLSLVSCKDQKSHSLENETVQDVQFDYLLGEWQRINDKEGVNTYEVWKKIKAQEWQGLGYTLNQADTVFKEDMFIRQLNGQWVYNVLHSDENVVFKMTRVDKDGFQTENPDNEFPKVIKYKRVADNLAAEISAGDVKVSFDFVPFN